MRLPWASNKNLCITYKKVDFCFARSRLFPTFMLKNIMG